MPFWRFVHNMIAHPLMELLPAAWGEAFHDFTGERAFGAPDGPRAELAGARAELARLKGTGATRGLAQLVGRERDAVRALRDLCEAQGLTLSARVRFHPLEPMSRNLDAAAEDDGTLHVWLDGPFPTEHLVSRG